jgi:glycerol-3-phosphate dehydrogenase (NAD(P)+)
VHLVHLWLSCPLQKAMKSQYGYDARKTDSVNKLKEDIIYLPRVRIPDNISCTADFGQAVLYTSITLLAIPTQLLRPFARMNRSTLPVGVPLVLGSKGIQLSSLQLPYLN